MLNLLTRPEAATKSTLAIELFRQWKKNARLKRSSTLQFDQEIRQQIGIEHNTYNILEEPALPSMLPPNTTINIDLLEQCSKNDPAKIIKANGIMTIESYIEKNFVYAFTDGSSDKT